MRIVLVLLDKLIECPLEYPSWILRPDAQNKLEMMLHGEARATQVAGLQCLSQLIAASKDTRNIDTVHRVRSAAREILHVQRSQHTPSWIHVLRDLLNSHSLQSKQTAVSCLARLVEDGVCLSSIMFPYVESAILDIIRGVCIAIFKGIQRDTPSTLSQIVDLLAKDRTGTHAVLVLYSMLDDIGGTLSCKCLSSHG